MEQITLVEVPDQLVLAIRKRGNYRIVPLLLASLFEFVFKKQVAIAGMPMLLLHETSKEEAEEADRNGTADVEVTVPVNGQVRTEGEIISYTLPGGTMARIVHLGPYENAGESYERLFAWISERDLGVKGPIREIYYNDPRDVKPEEIKTEILAPVG
jgi:effector-binding domain-containing protein